MKITSLSIAVIIGVQPITGFNIGLKACEPTGQDALDSLAQAAVSENPIESGAAIARLRSIGPEGMEALVHAHADMIQQHLKTTSSLGSEEEQTYWKRVKSALDSVSGQCDAYASRLYWYTNLADA